MQERTKIVALTDNYERIKAGEVGQTTEHFVVFKDRILKIKEVLAHLEDWEIRLNPSFVGTGKETAIDPDTGQEIPF